MPLTFWILCTKAQIAKKVSDRLKEKNVLKFDCNKSAKLVLNFHRESTVDGDANALVAMHLRRQGGQRIRPETPRIVPREDLQREMFRAGTSARRRRPRCNAGRSQEGSIPRLD